MIETEIKFKIQDFLFIKERLQAKGGVFKKRFFEDNIIFDDKKNSLLQKKSLLRLRKCNNIILTFKKRIEKGIYKVMEEHEVEVSDFDETVRILNLLGYKKVFRYQKTRETYTINNTHVLLDDTPIGNYIEIEGEKKDIEKIAVLLGFELKEGTSKNYMELYKEYCKIKGIQPSDMVFKSKP